MSTKEYIWYSYYIPMMAIPLFVFFSAMWIEPVRNERTNYITEMILVIIWLLLCVAVMTNALHSQMFKITVHPDKEYKRGWLYFAVIIWQVILGLGSISMMVRKCSLRAAKKLWYVPVLCVLAGFGLLIWYLVNGGSPRLFGYKLFHIHEAFCLPFIAGFESAIVIGLIPANSAYRNIFEHSAMKACIYDDDNRPALWSGDWNSKEEDPDLRLRKEEVSGGYIEWLEDISTIRRLNREIEEVTAELEDENDLIYAAFLSAYIKRTGNMMLIGDENGVVESGELARSAGKTKFTAKVDGKTITINVVVK